MDVRQLPLLVLLPLALLPGCRGAQLEREMLMRELRLQEDVIYDLERELEVCQRKLHAYVDRQRDTAGSPTRDTRSDRAPAWPTRDDAASPPAAAPGGRIPPPSDPPRLGTPPRIDVPPGVDPYRPPIIEFPGQSVTPPPFEGYPEIAPPGTVPEGIPAQPMPGSTAETARTASTVQQPAPPVANHPLAPAGALASVTLDRNQTGGFDADGIPGDDGILVVIEPRDAQGNVILAAADVAVVVVDPAADGPAARVARWDIRAGEVSRYFRSTNVGSGLYLRLPWPGRPPANNQVTIFVRLTTADGNQVVAEQTIDLKLPSVAGSPGQAGTQGLTAEPRTTAPPPLLPMPDPAAHGLPSARFRPPPQGNRPTVYRGAPPSYR